MNEVPDDRNLLRLLEPLSNHGDGDGGAHRAPHEADSLQEGHLLRGGVVDLDDPIPWFHAGFVGRSPLDGRYNRQDVVLNCNLYP